MRLKIPQITTLERGRIFFEEDFLYINFFQSPYYGALNQKHEDYNERHIFMNELLKEIYILHSRILSDNDQVDDYSFQHGHYRLLFLIETFVYWMRKNIDEMIGFNYYAHHFSKYGEEPKKLQISSIGNLISRDDHQLYSSFEAHIEKLKRINEISNTYKHSFINSEVHHLIGQDEPVINCLDMPWNSTNKPPAFHSYFLREIVEDYVAFFKSSRENLKKFKLRE